MIKFLQLPATMDGMKACFRRGVLLGDRLTAHFSEQTDTEGTIVMEMEKASMPFLNWPAKKRYISRYYEHPDGKPKIDAKGVQMKRRDGAPILVEAYRNCVNCIMPLEGGVKSEEQLSEEVVVEIEGMLSRIATDNIPMEGYVIAKSLKGHYKSTNLPHVALAEKTKQRIASGAVTRDPPKSGDRLEYVIVQGKKRSKLYERAEDPEWVRDHNLPIDRLWYIEHLEKPLIGLTEYFADVRPLFQKYKNMMRRIQDGNRSITEFFSKTNKRQALKPLQKPPKQKKKKKTNDIRGFFKVI